MTNQEAEEYANNMTYRDAINNLMKARSIPYRKATFIKVNELLKALSQEPSGDLISRQAVLKTLDDMDNVLDEDRTVENYKELLKECYEVLPSVNPQPCDDAIRAEIEQKCDRINSIASVLPYTAHREIQELLCEIMDLVKPQESEETETWNGIHGQITAPKGTFERIFNDADDDSDI